MELAAHISVSTENQAIDNLWENKHFCFEKYSSLKFNIRSLSSYLYLNLI